MNDATPVLIGAGQFTFRGEAAEAPGPLGLLTTAVRAAAADAGLAAGAMRALDALAVVGLTVDAPGALAALPVPRLANPPASLARALGAAPSWAVYSHMGGNSSQHAINTLAERIAAGENALGLVVGAETLGSLMKRLSAGLGFEGWDDPAGEGDPAPQRIGDPRPGASPQEEAHGLGLPVNAYPLFENALRARDHRSLEDHQRRIGALFARFTEVAANNPHAWFPKARSAEELITVTPANRMVSFPYPKYLNAIMQVDQSAAVLIASVAKARELGIPREKWVFLHGFADAHDLWNILDRQDYHSSPAMRLTGERALEMAGVSAADLAMIDLYSCFPSAVEIGAESLGLALDDPRGFTLTGGLPYFGGPGNNYSLHAVATLVERLRAAPGAFGLSSGNGWFLTKQSVGIYSTAEPKAPFARQDPAVIQRKIDALPHPEVVAAPQGPAAIETYTVVHSRDGYRMGIVIGRDGQGRRFVAHTPRDPELLAAMERTEQIGRRGEASAAADGAHNLFVPA